MAYKITYTNMDVRVIWEYDGDTLILLLDIGHHDILNQF